MRGAKAAREAVGAGDGTARAPPLDRITEPPDGLPPAGAPVGPRPVSTELSWPDRPGLFLAVRHLRRTPVEVVPTPIADLPRLSRRTIRIALRLNPSFLNRADLNVPIVVAGRGIAQVALDGRHRLARGIWTGRASLPTVRVPWRYALELLVPGPYEAEWLYLFVRRGLRRAAPRWFRLGGPPA